MVMLGCLNACLNACLIAGLLAPPHCMRAQGLVINGQQSVVKATADGLEWTKQSSCVTYTSLAHTIMAHLRVLSQSPATASLFANIDLLKVNPEVCGCHSRSLRPACAAVMGAWGMLQLRLRRRAGRHND